MCAARVRLNVRTYRHGSTAHTDCPCVGATQSKEGVKGRYWFMEADLRDGVALKADKTGKTILMVLRHLGRLQEVRRRLPIA